MDVEPSWAQKQLSDAIARTDRRLVNVQRLSSIHVPLDKSVLAINERVLSVPSLDATSKRSLKDVSSLQKPAKRPILVDIPSLDTHSGSNHSKQSWCAGSTFQLEDLTNLPRKTSPIAKKAEPAVQAEPVDERPRQGRISQNGAARCLQALLQGMESQLFTWHENKNVFESEDSIVIGGLSIHTQEQLREIFVQHGTNLRRLQQAVETIRSYITGCDGTVVALVVFVEDFLEYCRSEACNLSGTAKVGLSILQLCKRLDLVKESAAFLADLCDMRDGMRLNALKILDTVEAEVRLQTCIASVHDQLIRELFDRLLSQLMLEISSRTSLCQRSEISSGLLIAQESSYSSLHYREDSIPKLLTTDLCNEIVEVEKGMLFLEAHGSQTFLQTMANMRTTFKEFVSLNQELEEVEKAAHQVEITVESAQLWQGVQAKHAISSDIERQIMESASLTEPSRQSTSFRQAIARHTSQNSSIDVSQHIKDMLGPPLHRQGLFVHGEVLRILLHEMRLHDHLELAQDVFFLRNRHLAAGLREAIFSRNGSSLNINARNAKSHRWPPAAAKVSMATRRLLLQTVPARFTIPSTQPLAEVDFVGRLGFRMSLDDVADIPRDSLDALSFLVFNFQPHKPIDLIMTDRSMKLYNRINQFLLCLLRMSDAIDRLTRAAMQYRTMRRISPLFERFRIEASHFVRSFTAHIYETVIVTQCADFQRRLNRPGTSIEKLRDAHTYMLEQICHGALISHKMTEIQAILRRALEAVLAFSLLPQDDLTADQNAVQRLYDVFDENARKLITILAGAEATKEDSFAAGMTARFLMSDYYEAVM